MRAVGPAADLVRNAPAATVDHGEAVLLPGLVNAHAHLELSVLADTPPAEDFATWLGQVGPAAAALTRDQAEPAAASAIAACVAAGTALVGDVSDHGYAVPLLARSPLAARVYHEVLGFDPRTGGAGARRGARAARRWRGARRTASPPLARPARPVHRLDATSPADPRGERTGQAADLHPSRRIGGRGGVLPDGRWPDSTDEGAAGDGGRGLRAARRIERSVAQSAGVVRGAAARGALYSAFGARHRNPASLAGDGLPLPALQSDPGGRHGTGAGAGGGRHSARARHRQPGLRTEPLHVRRARGRGRRVRARARGPRARRHPRRRRGPRIRGVRRDAAGCRACLLAISAPLGTRLGGDPYALLLSGPEPASIRWAAGPAAAAPSEVTAARGVS